MINFILQFNLPKVYLSHRTNTDTDDLSMKKNWGNAAKGSTG